MRILVFGQLLSNGGTERVIAQLSVMWTELSHEVVFVTQYRRIGAEFEHASIAHESYGDRPLTEADVLQFCDKYRPDCFVINGGITRDDPFVALKALKARPYIRTILILHHSYSTWLYELACHEDFTRREDIVDVDVVVCVDPLLTLWWREMGAASFYIPNPVAIRADVCIQKDRVCGSHDSVVWAGRLDDPCKQAELAIKTFASVCEQCPDAKLIMLGKCGAVSRKKLLGQMSPHVRSKIELRGFVNNVSEVFSQAAVHLFTSEFEVTVPQVVLEAQACGVPTVAMDMPALAPVDDSAGVIKKHTSQDLTVEICRLLRDPAYREAISSAARVAAKSGRNDRVAEAWAELFGTISERPKLEALRHCNIEALSTVENYRLILQEEQRAQARFMRRHFNDLMQVKIWRNRLRKIRGILCGGTR